MLMSALGGLLLVLGLFSGTVLVLAPLGVVPWSASATLWVLFPLFSLAGYVAFVIGARTARIRTLSVAASGLLLILAAAAATGLVMTAASVVPPAGDTLSLWYVLAVAGTLGAVGAAAAQRDAERA
jgi:hypothetical protein